MLSPGSLTMGIGGNGKKVYACATCNTVVTTSDRLISIDGSKHHRFVNPEGFEFDFRTFTGCPGGIALGPAVAEHSWFRGYRWRLVFCEHCGQHLGWRYEAATPKLRPVEFWGILVEHLREPRPEGSVPH